MAESLLDTVGVQIGHAQMPEGPYHTGCTVFLIPNPSRSVCVVDVRGAAPSSHLHDLFSDPIKPICSANAIVFTGGSALGLRTIFGVVEELINLKVGLKTPAALVPLVPGTVIYDLWWSRGEWSRVPNEECGARALRAALDFIPGASPILQGSVGVGSGATCGKWSGYERAMKCGFGAASLADPISGVRVFAAAAVNAVGDVVDETGQIISGSRQTSGTWSAVDNPMRLGQNRGGPAATNNTTLAFISTNAPLSKAEGLFVAGRGHDGLAMSIRPIHTTADGDAVYVVSCPDEALPAKPSLDIVGNLAAEAVARAVRQAALASRNPLGTQVIELQ